MIKLEHAHIEEVRGIRKLDIDFQKLTFAISGPNGSGKSGVIDAIEFGLTGQIGRLMGRGTKGLSLSEHGPHVDKTKFPDAAFVELRVFIPALKKSATLTRKVSEPNKPKIVPADPDVLAVLAEIADHPEITLSRREILRFILIEPTKRSEEIQTILKLEDIGQTRAALNTALDRRNPRIGGRHDDVHLQAHQLGGDFGYPLGLGFGEPAFHDDVSTFPISMLSQALIERCGEMRRSSRSAWMENADSCDLGRLLGLRGKRRGEKAASQGAEERSSMHHSIT
jgi:hypothetical protein